MPFIVSFIGGGNNVYNHIMKAQAISAERALFVFVAMGTVLSK